MTQPQPPNPLLNARIVAAGMMTGVVVLWLSVGFVLKRPTTALPVSETVAAVGYAVIALAAMTAAFVIQRNAVDQTSQAAVYQRLVIAWTLLEVPAIFAGVCSLVFGARTLLAGAALIYFAGMFKTFPRADWFAGKA